MITMAIEGILKMKKKEHAGKIVVFLALMITTVFTSCKGRNEKDPLQNFLLLAFILNSYSRPLLDIRYDTTVHNSVSVATATGALASDSNSPSLLSTENTVNLAGRDITDYGDGDTDGFTDKFLTPGNVVLGVIGIYAYKSPENGGPALGEETDENGEVLYECDAPPDAAYCYTPMNVAPGVIDGNADYLANMTELPDSTYDRMGIALINIQQEFSPDDIDEPNLRFYDFALKSETVVYEMGTSDLTHMKTRGVVTYGSPAYDYSYESDGLTDHEGQYSWTTLNVADKSFQVKSNSGTLNVTNYWGASLMHSPFVPETYTPVAEDAPMLFELPIDFNRDNAYYLKVINIDNPAALDEAAGLIVYVDPSNTFFWDSDPADTTPNSFDPAVDAPGAGGIYVSGKDALLHLPILALGYQ